MNDEHIHPKIPQESLCFTHCVMNFPEEAIFFLDVFVGLFKNADRNAWFEDPDDINTLK